MTWGRTYLWIAILIFAAAASVVARLVEIGEANLIDGRNPISFCNLLFAGNLVAALTLFALYHREWHPTRLRTLSRRQWLIQTVLALTSGAIAPAMMFTAIAHTSVTNIVLIETIEIPPRPVVGLAALSRKVELDGRARGLVRPRRRGHDPRSANGRVAREYGRSANAGRSGLR